MEYNLFEIMLKGNLKGLQIELNREQIEKFYSYMNLLLEWNEKINLTAITNPEEVITKHFVDSLTINKYIVKNSRVIDIGTGAGFPGIPLNILRNDIDLLLLDSLNKRIIFLDDIIEKLKLEKVKTIHARAEELGQDKKFREQYDTVVSRAVAPLNVLLEYMLPYVKVGGKCICMKGPKLEEELEQSKISIDTLGGKVEEIDETSLPNTDIKRNILVVRKIRIMDSKYPRKMTNIKSNPL